MLSKIKRTLIRKIQKPVIIKNIPDDITDEIEKAMWILKEDLDLPTEEVERSLECRKNLHRKN